MKQKEQEIKEILRNKEERAYFIIFKNETIFRLDSNRKLSDEEVISEYKKQSNL